VSQNEIGHAHGVATVGEDVWSAHLQYENRGLHFTGGCAYFLVRRPIVKITTCGGSSGQLPAN